MGLSREVIERANAVRQARRARIVAAPPRSLLELADISADEFRAVLARGIELKARPGDYGSALSGKQVALVFQKTSTRTRVSFETGVSALGGHPLYMDWKTSNFTLASLEDEIRVLSRYVDLTVARVFSHQDLELMATHSEVPVINGLSDWTHPCQGLADFMTIQEYFGATEGVRVVYVGDGNNVTHSLMAGALHAGAHITLCCPPQYAPNGFFLQRLSDRGLSVRIEENPQKAVADADVIYTDTWVSMGEEHLAETKVRAFDGYQIDSKLMAQAPDHCLVMHCLPAHRGMEISGDVLASSQSVVFDQAENRRYVQQAVMLWLLKAAV